MGASRDPRRKRGAGTRPVTFSCSSRSRATSGARSGAAAEAEAEAEAWGPGSGGASMAGAPRSQRGERVLNKCLWRRRGRQLPSARVLALMHCAPRAEEAAPAFSAAAAAAARVPAARGRISHVHAARRRAAADLEQQAGRGEREGPSGGRAEPGVLWRPRLRVGSAPRSAPRGTPGSARGPPRPLPSRGAGAARRGLA